MHGSVLLILLPCRPCEVSSDDGFNREDLELAHLHAPILEHGSQIFRDLWREVEGKEMSAKLRNSLLDDFEPFGCALGEVDAFAGNSLSYRS